MATRTKAEVSDALLTRLGLLGHNKIRSAIDSGQTADIALAADDPVEQASDRAAAEFLVPERRLREVWPSVRNQPERFQEVARRFKVSEIVVARRALDTRLINKDSFLSFYRDYQSRERGAPRPARRGW